MSDDNVQIHAFDTSIGTNFTNDACPQFFDKFTHDSAFVDCKPMSFFLQNSQGFTKQLRKGLAVTEHVVADSCAVDVDKCKTVMDGFSKQLKKHCAQDLDQQNPLVLQAHNDFMAYEMIYQVTCLPIPESKSKNNTATSTSSNTTRSVHVQTRNREGKTVVQTQGSANHTDKPDSRYHTHDARNRSNPSPHEIPHVYYTYDQRLDSIDVAKRDDGRGTKAKPNFCYSEAIWGANAQNNLDSYLYMLPLGQQYPGTGSSNNTLLSSNNTVMKTSCSECTQQIMKIFHSYTSNTDLPITDTYGPAAKVIDKNCRAGFVNERVLAPKNNGSQATGKKKDASSGAMSLKRSWRSSAPGDTGFYAALPTGLVMIVVINILLSVLG